jgi:hypothetical protein
MKQGPKPLQMSPDNINSLGSKSQEIPVAGLVA